MSTTRIGVAILLLTGSTLVAGCGQRQWTPSVAKAGIRPVEASGAMESPNELPAAASLPQKLAEAQLPNAFRIHEKVIAGGLPAGDAAFRELHDLGVKTIISVDGAKPNLALAKKYGLKYVHLPHGYDGIPDARVQELAKAVRDLPGPIYIHCHHGKHRSPAAAAVACVSVGWIEPAAGLAVLQAAGTSPHYRGLYESVKSARSLNEELLDALRVEFPESAQLPPLAAAMVAIEHTHDRLQSIAAAGWCSQESHPDLDPPHEALLLREQFTEMLRTDQVKSQPDSFQRLLRDSELACEQLETGLREWRAAKSRPSAPALISAAFEKITANCSACHRQFRDLPLSEKQTP